MADSMLLRQGLLMVVSAAIVGIAATHLSGRFLESLIDGARPIGLAMSAGLILILALVASAGIWYASRRYSAFGMTQLESQSPPRT